MLIKFSVLLLIIEYCCGLPSINTETQPILDRFTRSTGCINNDVYRLLSSKPSIFSSMDICLLVSAHKGMTQKWLQPLATAVDLNLQKYGIGTQKGNENHFCVIQFGARGPEVQARFVRNMSDFFGSDQMTTARKYLRNNGYVSDGYQALKYAIDNVQFRQEQTVGRSFILVANTGRSILSTSSNLTTPLLKHLLKASNITLDVIVNMTLSASPSLGFLDTTSNIQYSSPGKYRTVLTPPNIVQAHSNTLSTYVNLSMETGGGAWSMESTLSDASNTSLMSSLAAAMINGWSVTYKEVCQVCMCDGVTCVDELQQAKCRRCINDTESEECKLIFQPSSPQFNQIIATVTQGLHSNVATISFRSNSPDTVYRCLHINSTFSPVLSYCTSPVTLEGLINGYHLVLITGMASNGVHIAKLVKFKVEHGPLKVIFKQPTVDYTGTMTIPFATTRTTNIRCVCHVPASNLYKSCADKYIASPKVLNSGSHTLTVSCYDSTTGFFDKNSFNFVLGDYIEKPAMPLSCQVLTSYPQNSMVSVNFSCNRYVHTSCSVANLPFHSCSNNYSFTTQSLSPGNHPFTVTAADKFGSTYTVTTSFRVEKINRRCCPVILKDLTNLVITNATNHEVLLKTAHTVGNCSVSEGFRYAVDWGDNSSLKSSISYHSSLLSFPRVFSQQTTQSIVTFSYCNNPSTANNICCDHKSFHVSFPH